MTNTNNRNNELNTYCVQARLGDLFEDVYVTARNEQEAIKTAAKQLKGTALDSRWTRFVM